LSVAEDRGLSRLSPIQNSYGQSLVLLARLVNALGDFCCPHFVSARSHLLGKAGRQGRLLMPSSRLSQVEIPDSDRALVNDGTGMHVENAVMRELAH
jgi:hypothetical protein